MREEEQDGARERTSTKPSQENEENEKNESRNSLLKVNGKPEKTPAFLSSKASGPARADKPAKKESGASSCLVNETTKQVPLCMSFVDGRYSLYAVINHTGELNRGHCFSTIRSNEKWLEFSDDRVREVSKDAVVDSSAYILFYVRKDVQFAQLEDLYSVNLSKEAMDAGIVRSKPVVAPQRRALCSVM